LNLPLNIYRHYPREFMKKHLAMATLVTLTMAISSALAWSADSAADIGQVKLQSASIPTFRQSIASAAGYELKSIGLKHTVHQVKATFVNSKQNDAASAGREKEATEMATAMEWDEGCIRI
jgi:hypothetical protein